MKYPYTLVLTRGRKFVKNGEEVELQVTSHKPASFNYIHVCDFSRNYLYASSFLLYSLEVLNIYLKFAAKTLNY